MSRLLLIMVIVLFAWYERDIVVVAFAPTAIIIAGIASIVLILATLICEIALMIIAPIALFLGYDSRKWYLIIIRNQCSWFSGDKTNES